MKPLNFIYHKVKRQKLHIKHNSHVDKKQSSEGLTQNTSWLNCLVHWTDFTKKEIFLSLPMYLRHNFYMITGEVFSTMFDVYHQSSSRLARWKHMTVQAKMKKDVNSISIAPVSIIWACLRIIGIAMLPTADAPVINLAASIQLHYIIDKQKRKL